MARSVPADARAGPRDCGSAVAEFVLVSILVVGLLLAVLQVAVYVHVRNVVAASAQDGARYGANADVPSEAGGERTRQLVAGALSAETAEGLRCTAGEQVGRGGAVLVVVTCSGAVPSLFTALGELLPVQVTGRAVKEGR